MGWIKQYMKQYKNFQRLAIYKVNFPLREFVRANSQKVGTDPTFSQRIFSPTNHNAKIFAMSS